MFQAQTQADLDTVLARLAAVEEQLAELEAAAPAAALRSALGTGTDDDALMVARLPVLRAERDSLLMARDAAAQAEADRLAAAKNRELASQVRAAQQHLATCQKELTAACAAADQLTKCYTRAIAASRSTVALLPQSIRRQAYAELMFSPKRLRRYLLIEMTRVGRQLGESVVADYASGSFVRDVEDRSGKIPPGGDLLARDLAMLKSDLRDILQKVLPAAGPPPAAGEAASDAQPSSEAAPLLPEDVEEAA